MISALEAAELKLNRAAEHIKEISPHVTAYAARVLHDVVANPEGRETVNVRHFPPPEISILAGEAIYNIRCALDYLAFDLVKLNPQGVKLPPRWDERCDFPLRTRTPKTPPAYNCFEGTLPGISKGAFAFIESAQPYHRGNGLFSLPSILWFIAQLSNIDKHRHLNLTPVGIGHLKTVINKFGMGQFVYRVIRNGAELEPASRSDDFTDIVKVGTEFSYYVTFDESALGEGPDALAVQYLLEACLKMVKGIVVPAFREFLK